MLPSAMAYNAVIWSLHRIDMNRKVKLCYNTTEFTTIVYLTLSITNHSTIPIQLTKMGLGSPHVIWLYKILLTISIMSNYQSMDEVCSQCKESCSSDCRCWCHGIGGIGDIDDMVCSVCYGLGKVVTADYESYLGAMYKPCPKCGGDLCESEPKSS